MSDRGLPWYKRDPQRFLDGVQGLGPEATGAYSVLIDLIYARGGRTRRDDRHLSGILGCSVRKAKALTDRLLDLGKLYLDGQYLLNDRATKVVRSARKLSADRAEAGRKGGQARAEATRNHVETDARPSRNDDELTSSDTRNDAENDVRSIGINDLPEARPKQEGQADKIRERKEEEEEEEEEESNRRPYDIGGLGDPPSGRDDDDLFPDLDLPPSERPPDPPPETPLAAPEPTLPEPPPIPNADVLGVLSEAGINRPARGDVIEALKWLRTGLPVARLREIVREVRERAKSPPRFAVFFTEEVMRAATAPPAPPDPTPEAIREAKIQGLISFFHIHQEELPGEGSHELTAELIKRGVLKDWDEAMARYFTVDRDRIPGGKERPAAE